MEESERARLTALVDGIWPRVEAGDATLEEVRATALSVFDRLGAVGGLDRWEKHHFVWVLKGLALNRAHPGAGLHTALRGLEQTLAPPEARAAVADPELDGLEDGDLRELVAAA
ncbi:MAG: hypothetical protein AB7M12_04205 [Hyphomonadaceae bacterium]